MKGKLGSAFLVLAAYLAVVSADNYVDAEIQQYAPTKCPIVDNWNVTLLPNPKNCSTFFSCVKGTPVLMTCPPGMHFNPELLVCDDPKTAKCKQSKFEDNEDQVEVHQPIYAPTKCPAVDNWNVTLLPNPKNCSTFFSCVKGTPVLMSCPPGMHFNPELLVCDDPKTAKCKQSKFEDNEDQVEVHQPIYAPTKCPAVDNWNVTLLPNPKNCSTFFSCVKGTPVLMTCPPGMHFNPELLVCDDPKTAKCKQSKFEDNEGQVEVHQPIYAPTKCPAVDNWNVTLLPNPKNCSTFFSCVKGTPVLMTCPPGMHFNPELLVCDDPKTAKCKQSKFEDNEDQVEVHQPIYAPTKCPAVDNWNVTLLPNPKNCSTFFSCVKGTPVLMTCPPGMHFNPELLVCDDPKTAKCKQSKSDDTERHFEVLLPVFAPSKCPLVDGPQATLLPNPEDCSTYFSCVKGTLVLMICPAGLHFNTELSVCDAPENAKCKEVGLVNDDSEDDVTGANKEVGLCPAENDLIVTLLPHPESCSSFYSCVHGTPVRMECPRGLHFNPELSVCDAPKNANCNARAPKITM